MGTRREFITQLAGAYGGSVAGLLSCVSQASPPFMPRTDEHDIDVSGCHTLGGPELAASLHLKHAPKPMCFENGRLYACKLQLLPVYVSWPANGKLWRSQVIKATKLCLPTNWTHVFLLRLVVPAFDLCMPQHETRQLLISGFSCRP